VNWDSVDFSKSPAILSMPVTSSICRPPKGSILKPGKNTIMGYAYSGGGNRYEMPLKDQFFFSCRSLITVVF
jgi:hypothetical protein